MKRYAATVLVLLALAAGGRFVTNYAGGDPDGRLGPAGVSVQDDVPAVTRLDPALLAAVREAARAAEGDGVELRITSGWRSRAYQEELLEKAIAEHGSRAAALRWVKTPDDSTHVSGRAVDVGPTKASYWMARYGNRFGLCQVYANEIWHYELLTAPGSRCPAMHPDSASSSTEEVSVGGRQPQRVVVVRPRGDMPQQ